MEKKDTVLSFKDLCCRILLGWRSIIACTIIFGLLLCSFKFLKDSKNSAAPVIKGSEALAATMTDEQIASAKGAVACKQLFDSHATAMANSILLKIPYSAVPTETITLTFRGDSAFTEASALATKLKNNMLLTEIADTLGLSGAQVSELISAKVSFPEGDFDNTATLIATVYGRNTDETAAIGSAVNNFISINANSSVADNRVVLNANGNSTDVVLSVAPSEEVRLYQNNAVNLYNNLRGALKEALTLLDSAETAYYNAAVAELDSSSAESAAPIAAKAKPSLKYLVLGAAIGFILAAFYHFAAYLFARRLKSAEDLAVRCELRILGEQKQTAKKLCFIDRFILKVFGLEKNDTTEFIAQNIIAAMKTGGYEKLLVVSDCLEDNFNVDLIAAGLNFALASAPDAAAISAAENADCILLIEKQGDSRYSEIRDKKTLSEICGKPILGAVVIR